MHTDGAMLGEAMDHPPQSLVVKDMFMSLRGTDSSAKDSNQTLCAQHGGRAFQFNFMFQPVL